MSPKFTNPTRYVFYDIESTSPDSSTTQMVQIALIETDGQLNILKDENNKERAHMFYIKMRPDIIPEPGAFLVHKVDPEWVGHYKTKNINSDGKRIPEHIFSNCKNQPDGPVYNQHEANILIQSIMTRTGNTCIAGYNSEKFDDEVIRHNFYRNMLEPYSHEWANGNHRADIIKAVQIVRMYSEKALKWPIGEDGKVSMKLERLSVENGLVHEKAHDALSDIYATIFLAKLIKDRRPSLWDKFKMLSDKQNVSRLVNSGEVLTLTQMFIPKEKYGTTLALPLFQDNQNKNKYYLIDLLSDIEPILSMDADDLRDYIYSKKVERALKYPDININIRSVSINKSPAINIPPSKFLGEDSNEVFGRICDRVGTERETFQTNLHFVRNNLYDLKKKISEVYSVERTFDSKPIYSALYDGFFSNKEKDVREDTLKIIDDRRAIHDIDAFEIANNNYANHEKNLLLFIYSKWGAFEKNWNDLHDVSDSTLNELILYCKFCEDNINGTGEGIGIQDFHKEIFSYQEPELSIKLSQNDKDILLGLEHEVKFIKARFDDLNRLLTPAVKLKAQRSRELNPEKFSRYDHLFEAIELNSENNASSLSR